VLHGRGGAVAVTQYRVLAHPYQPGRLADATALGDVLKNRLHLVCGKAAVEERCPLAFGEPHLAALAIKQSALVLAVPSAHGQVACSQLAEVGAGWVLAAQRVEVGHPLTPDARQDRCRLETVRTKALPTLNAISVPRRPMGDVFRPYLIVR